MNQTYRITGMTCSNCETQVKTALEKIQGVTVQDISRENETVRLDLAAQYDISELQNALPEKYRLKTMDSDNQTEQVFQLSAYKPLWILFGYILLVSALPLMSAQNFSWMQWMPLFMAGFFLSFSFFKMLDLKGFANSYSTYDLFAKFWKPWAYMYAFIELLLGLSYLTGFEPLLTNSVTFIVMTLSLIGVLRAVLKKRKIQCACLGTVFNLPMSTVTIVEDALMIGMSIGMLAYLY